MKNQVNHYELKDHIRMKSKRREGVTSRLVIVGKEEVILKGYEVVKEGNLDIQF